MKEKVYAIEHLLGLSLVKAKSPHQAIVKARERFGTHAAPFTLPDDQVMEIVHAKAMGASVIE